MAPKQCQVCKDAQSKYKCPSCLIPYCSLGCFKKHKETPCAKPVPITEEKPIANPELPIERPLTVDATTQILQKPELESIACSNEIRNALSDESIRNLISSIDSAADPQNELDKAMGVEAFRLFTDKILSIHM
ncbi:uncharacterized protein [Euphorbia lathyris]|uniref:uncharacterized protein isoform X2 n=1 Tax=Euphorbia lathyris TaxID=212925 RepID=UPI0033130DD0